MIAAAIVGGALILAIRRRLFGESTESMRTPPLSLHEIRRMRDNGEIDEGEFERLKALIIGEVVSTPHPNVAELRAAKDRKAAEEVADEPTDRGFGDIGDSPD
ncbi:MAG: hypothetical protein AAGD00_03020 [Planctomycetota bacterium]